MVPFHTMISQTFPLGSSITHEYYLSRSRVDLITALSMSRMGPQCKVSRREVMT